MRGFEARQREGQDDSQEIRNPKGVEEISSSRLLLSVVLPEVQEVEDVRVPRLEVDAVWARERGKSKVSFELASVPLRDSLRRRRKTKEGVLTRKLQVACFLPDRRIER